MGLSPLQRREDKLLGQTWGWFEFSLSSVLFSSSTHRIHLPCHLAGGALLAPGVLLYTAHKLHLCNYKMQEKQQKYSGHATYVLQRLFYIGSQYIKSPCSHTAPDMGCIFCQFTVSKFWTSYSPASHVWNTKPFSPLHFSTWMTTTPCEPSPLVSACYDPVCPLAWQQTDWLQPIKMREWESESQWEAA